MSVIKAIHAIGREPEIISFSPISLRKAPLDITRKYRRGFAIVMYCSHKGILAIGVAKPDKMIDGEIKKNIFSSACC